MDGAQLGASVVRSLIGRGSTNVGELARARFNFCGRDQLANRVDISVHGFLRAGGGVAGLVALAQNSRLTSSSSFVLVPVHLVIQLLHQLARNLLFMTRNAFIEYVGFHEVLVL